MSFNKLKSLLSEDSDKSLVESLGSDRFNNAYLISSGMNMLSDEVISCLNNEKALSLFRLIKTYFNNCFSIYIDDSVGHKALEKLLPFLENTIYYVNAPDGERIATINEVNSGVEQLIAKTIPAVESNIAEYLELLMWTFTGRVRYYGKSGLEYTYENGRLKESFYQLTLRAGNKLKEMLDWISVGGNYDRAIAALKIAKKSSKYKYPSFASDEISCNYTPKQIYYFCSKSLNGMAYTEVQSQACKILYLIDKKGYKPLPHEISIMRRAYNEICTGNYSYDYTNIKNEEARETCKLLDTLKNNGKTDKNDFVFKVIETIKKTGNTSEKQLNILRTYKERISTDSRNEPIKVKETKETNKVNSGSELNELFELSDALGSGKIGE